MLMLMLTFLFMPFFIKSKKSSLTGMWILTFTLILSLLTSMKSISPISQCSPLLSLNNFNNWMNNISLWVTLMMILVSIKYKYQNMKFMYFLSVTSFLLIFNMGFFMTDNLVMLYVLFEASLIPTLILIIQWGYQPERLKSAFYFVMYTICASLPLLLMMMKVMNCTYSSIILDMSPMLKIEYNTMKNISYLALTMAFMVKIPMWGVHLWLPKAHVEAPVSGSMILAGILLKLGGWGMIQISKFLLLTSKMKYLLFSINLWGSMVVGLICLTAVDMKILIAYSSIVHMNLMTLGIISNTTLGLYGAMLMMISHGISSPGMFALANLNYESTKTRNLMLQKGFLLIQPTMMLFWFVVAAANMAAPPSLNLASEILIYISVLKYSIYLFVIPLIITFMGGAYNLYLFSSQSGKPNKLTLPHLKINMNSMIMSMSLSMPVFIVIFVTHMMNQY